MAATEREYEFRYHRPARRLVELRQQRETGDLVAPEGWWIVQVVDSYRVNDTWWRVLALVEYEG